MWYLDSCFLPGFRSLIWSSLPKMRIVKSWKHRKSLSVMIHQLESLNLYDVTDHYSLIAMSKEQLPSTSPVLRINFIFDSFFVKGTMELIQQLIYFSERIHEILHRWSIWSFFFDRCGDISDDCWGWMQSADDFSEHPVPLRSLHPVLAELHSNPTMWRLLWTWVIGVST